MSKAEQPEALRLAEWLVAAVQIYPQRSEDDPGGYTSEVDQVMDEAAAELRRLHAENTTLQQGYDAARLEIEALRAAPTTTTAAVPAEGWVMVPVEATVSMREAMRRGTGMSFSETKIAYNSMLAAAPKAEPAHVVSQNAVNLRHKSACVSPMSDKPAGEYPPLPEPKFTRAVDGIPCITLLEHELLMRAYVDADRAMRTQAAPACKECDGTGTVAGSQAHFACPQCKAAPAIDTDGVFPEWTAGSSKFKEWCSTHFGSDADESYLAEAVLQLPRKADVPTMAADEFELRRLLVEERATTRQLSRALAEAIEPPNFMGEPALPVKAAPAAVAGPVAQGDAASTGFFLQLPQRPKPEAPAGTVGLDWDAYSGAQMLAYGRDCSNAAIVSTQKQGCV